MPYVLISGGVVVQKQPYEQDWFIAAPDWVVCGYLYSNGAFTAPTPVTPTPTGDAVDAERDRRIQLGFDWNGKHYQSGAFDRDNILSMGAAAGIKVNTGSQVGDYRWFNPAADFYWIAADNSHVTMDAFDMIDFAMTAATWVSANILAASAIKMSNPIPSSYASDPRWP